MFALQNSELTKRPAGEKAKRRDPSPGGKGVHALNPVWQALATRPAAVRPKLSVGASADPYEREADALAERVMRAAGPPSPPDEAESASPHGLQPQRACACQSPSTGAGHCAECGGRKEDRLQLQRDGTEENATARPGPQHTHASSGQPLDPATRAFMESRFGHGFGDVHIHADTSAAESARAINARAYTVGSEVVFGAGQYRPETESGKRLLAHELTHVLQQRAGQTDSAVQKARSLESAAKSYTVDETISAVNFALSAAAGTLADPNLDPARAGKISRLAAKLQSFLPRLEQARGTDGEGLTLDFDADPKKNEINPGDSEKSLTELFGRIDWSTAGQSDLAPQGQGTPSVAQASALPGGLRVTPLLTPGVQRCEAVCVIIIIVSGLLAAGCQSSGPAPGTTPCTPQQAADISAHRTTAQGWVNAAITKLSAYQQNTDTPEAHTIVANALNANFHTNDPALVTRIAARLTQIKTIIDTLPADKFKCICNPNAAGQTPDAFTYGTGGNAEIHLCPGWFSSRDDIRRHTTVIHEAGHASGLSGAPQPNNMTQDIYEFHTGYATMTPDTALQNPDPFAVFIRQLFHNGSHPPGTHR
ncbi:MAG: hypothetical protein AUG51_22060 [Acidobacteria bacterium 13_1_20CM_3_53_8]|nr:MAG: hypothetical protein AUG51_22060 [Acidobacteria bacterium 13_1_20CM_3_53_8]